MIFFRPDQVNFYIECLIKLAASIVCGFVLGIERKSRNHVVGMRTLILISVSSCLLSIMSYYQAAINPIGLAFTGGDSTRISAGVVSGIGFLGGGAILRQGLNIKGLTSAAIIWASSSLGLAIGAGMYIPAAAVLIVIVIVLVLLEKVEEKYFPAVKIKTLHLVFEGDSVDMESLKKTIEKNGYIIIDLNMSRIMANHQLILHYTVKAPSENDFTKLLPGLQSIGKLSEFSLTD